MPFFYVDWYYIVLVLPAVILSLWASAHVKSTFRRYSQVRNARGMTGAEEFNASHRALRAIEESALLLPEEQTAAKRVLTAAALTYVAALSVTIMQFLRLLLIVTGGNRRRD